MAIDRSEARVLIEHARHVDYDRYLCALFAPAEARLDLFALIAFNYELARVRETVSEPMLGRIRLQWWREQVEGLYAGTPRRHELSEPLRRAIERGCLSRQHFDALIDARERDLDDAPFADLAALEAYAGSTAGPLGALMAEALGARDVATGEAARAAHTAFALVGLMRAVPFHAGQNRLFVPLDLLGAHGATIADVLAGRFSAALGAAIGEVLDRSAKLSESAGVAARTVPRSQRAALLPAILAALYGARLRGVGCNPFAPGIAVSPLRRQIALWVATTTVRF